MYSKKALQHFKKPKNFGIIKNADGIGRAGNPVCGDVMEVYIKVNKGKIKDCKFRTYGCVAAIAASDVLCELCKGKTIKQAKKITAKQISDYLGKLPTIKLHCSVLGRETLKKAIEDYEKRN